MSSKAEAPANSERTAMTHVTIERAKFEQVLEALEEIALAGMSGTGQESEEAMTAWHARQAWKFIGIAARALEPIKQARSAPLQEPVAFDDWPEYHEHAMGCGLEDRGITDRYEAMRYGWDEALERAWEAVNLHGPLYTTPPAQPSPVPSTLPEFSPIFDGITKGGAA
jgi:hypothetical protein